jgi:hypothetical protein
MRKDCAMKFLVLAVVVALFATMPGCGLTNAKADQGYSITDTTKITEPIIAKIDSVAATSTASIKEIIEQQRQEMMTDIKKMYDENSASRKRTRSEAVEENDGKENTSPGDSTTQTSPDKAGLDTPRLVTINGKLVDADSFIGGYWKRDWTYPGGIEGHIVEHGVKPDEIKDFTLSDLERLHAAIHEQELEGSAVKKVSQSAVKSKSVQLVGNQGQVSKYSTYARTSGCPNGQCPVQQYSYRTIRRR